MSDKILVTVSRVKEYVEEKHGLRLSGAAAEILTGIVERACDEAAVHAKFEKRLTIKDRDFQSR